jgi:poly(hydroxyalkanoate) depolymerase family esterase
MAGLRQSIADLHARRQRFAELLAAARRGATGTRAPATRPLPDVAAFGSNPGDLGMRIYAAQRLAPSPALIVALHGCGQTVEEYARGTGWPTFADRHGCVVVFPEQRPQNNASHCFSWFQAGDIARDRGEALSIRQMVEHAAVRFGVDPRRVFATGLSAGGAMVSAMLATYPDVFAGGAVLAGLPYGCAASAKDAFAAMFTERALSGPALGDRVRAASKHRGPWPKISVWHGSSDPIVKPCNGEDIIRQWADLHGLSPRPSREERIAGHTRRLWLGADGSPRIEAFTIAGMAHAVPLACSAGADAYGAVGPFFLDVGICSTRRIAQFWGLEPQAGSERQTAAEAVPASAQLAATAGDAIPGSIPGASRERADLPPPQADAPPLEATAAIAAAFKAAGLRLPRGSGPLAPATIIAAALEAAGLRK